MGMKVNGTSGLTFPDTTTLGSAGQSSVQAWVNFNGTGTVAIRANFNVASITDNGVGDYTVNFTNALVDANYAFSATGEINRSFAQVNSVPPTTTSCRFAQTVTSTFASSDSVFMAVAIFR